jgi:hypothetical protein
MHELWEMEIFKEGTKISKRFVDGLIVEELTWNSANISLQSGF